MLRALRWLAVLFALLIIGAVWQAAHAQATDSTVYIALRTRTGSTGKIVSTSATKLDKLPSARVDTLRIPLGRDTVYWSPQYTTGRDSVIWFGPYAWPSGCVVGCKPPPFKLPLVPRAGRVDTVVVVRVDTVYRTPPPVPPPVVTPPAVGTAHAPELPRGTVDTTMPVAPAGSVIIKVP